MYVYINIFDMKLFLEKIKKNDKLNILELSWKAVCRKKRKLI